MNVKNQYYYFQNALSKEQCQYIIDAGLKTLEENKKLGNDTFGTTGGNQSKHDLGKNAKPMADITLEEVKKSSGKEVSEIHNETFVRDSEVAWLGEEKIYNWIWPFINKCNVEAGWQYEFTQSELMQFTVYRPGGFYGWHQDGQSDHYGKYKKFIPGITPTTDKGNIPPNFTTESRHVGLVRKISLTINLNEPGDYEGGNLKFDFGPHAENDRYHLCEEIRPQGSLVCFPSFVHHQVTPVEKGTRYSLVLWILGRPFK